MATSPGFSTEVDWAVQLQRDGTILHEITVTLHDVLAGIFSFAPRYATTTSCALGIDAAVTWLETEVLAPVGAGLQTPAWGFDPINRTFNIGLLWLPSKCLVADLVQLRARYTQHGAVQSLFDVRTFRLDVECIPPQAWHANLTVRIRPRRNHAERLVDWLLRGVRLLPKERIVVRSSAKVDVNQAEGVIQVAGTEIRAPLEVAYLEIAVWRAVLQYLATFLAGLVPFVAREAGEVLLRR